MQRLDGRVPLRLPGAGSSVVCTSKRWLCRGCGALDKAGANGILPVDMSRLCALAGVAVALFVLTASASCAGDDEETRSQKQRPAAIASVVATIVAPGAGQVAAGAGAVWITNGDGSLSRIDPDTNKLVATVKVGGPNVCCIAVGEGGVWVSDSDDNAIFRIDPATNAVAARIAVGLSPHGIAVDHGSVWVAHEHDGSVRRIDRTTNALVAKIRVGRADTDGPLAIAVAAGSIWVSVPNARAVVRIDASINRVTAKIPVEQECAFGPSDEVIWVGGGCGGTRISRIDPKTNTVSPTVDLSPDIPGTPALDPPYVWVVTFSGVLVRIDTRTNAITGKLPLKEFNVEGESVTPAFGSIWIRVRDSVLRFKAT